MSVLSSEEVRTTVHELEVKRGSRRGTATKLHHRISKIINDGPDRINSATLQDLATQLSHAIDAHTALQSQLDEFYDNFADLRSSAKAEDDANLLDTHVAWRATVNDVLKALPLRRKAASLLSQIESALESPIPDSPFFRTMVDKLHERHVAVIDDCSELHHALSDLRSICDAIIAKMSTLFTLTATACKEAPPPATPVAAAPAVVATPPASDRHALNIELPSFDGDPFKWANFRTMFKQTISKRARGHTNLEIKGLLIKATKHPDGLKVLHNLPSDDVPLDDMLDRLEAIFGAPDVLAPLIIRKILSVQSCSLSAADIDNLYEKFLLPYNKFCSLNGDSLGAFLAAMASSFMTPECRREWVRHRPPDTPPDMKNLSRFIDFQRKELRGASTLTSGPPPPVSQHLPPRPSSPRADRSRPAAPKSAPPAGPHNTALCAVSFIHCLNVIPFQVMIWIRGIKSSENDASASTALRKGTDANPVRANTTAGTAEVDTIPSCTETVLLLATNLRRPQ